MNKKEYASLFYINKNVCASLYNRETRLMKLRASLY